MGQTPSKCILDKHGYTLQKESVNGITIATSKQGEPFVIKKINISLITNKSADELNTEIEALKNISHPHISNYRNSFQDKNESGVDCHYVVRDHCLGGNLAERISAQKESGQEFQEEQIMTWIVQLCMAGKYCHNKGLLHKDIKPQTVLLTEFGSVILGEFGDLNRKSSPEEEAIHYLSPETLNAGLYDTKSEIWSIGCILYELCMLELAFSAQSTVQLTPKIQNGPYPSLPKRFSPELRQLLCDIFQTDPTTRPSAKDILGKPFILSFLMRKSRSNILELRSNLKKLNDLADGLERVHKGTTIGSLTGGVFGAAGGITSIVGLILAPFTLGVSLIVTGVGIGVAVAGGAAAGASNVTNMYKQFTDRRSVKNIVKEVEEKTNSVVQSLKDIGEALETHNPTVDSADSADLPENRLSLPRNLMAIGARAGRGLAGIPELVRLVQVTSAGKAAAQSARASQVAQSITGVLSSLFVAVDIYFIGRDAKEIHRIGEAQTTRTENSCRLNLIDTEVVEVKSETMKCIGSVRQTIEHLQGPLNELTELLHNSETEAP